jgi:hypothetical protein
VISARAKSTHYTIYLWDFNTPFSLDIFLASCLQDFFSPIVQPQQTSLGATRVGGFFCVGLLTTTPLSPLQPVLLG